MKLFDPELEKAVLGSCILEPSLLLELNVTESDFYVERNKHIWTALLWLHAEGDGVDTLRLHERLSAVGKINSVGGHDYLLSLTDTVPLRNPPTKRLRELAKLRAIMEHARRVVAICSEADLEKTLAAITDLQAVASDTIESEVSSAMECATKVLHELSGASKRVLRVHPGLELFAEFVGDLAVGSMTVVGAQNNTGKSSLAIEMCGAGAERGVVFGYASFEDPEVLVGTRVLSMYAGVSSAKIERKNINAADWSRITGAYQKLEELGESFLVSTRVGGTHLDACAIITRMAQKGCKLVIVDYLQAIEWGGEPVDRRNEMRKVASAIKKHGARVGVAVVLLSQLSRPPKDKPNREPTKFDLKESGDIEDAAENVVLMWREEEDDFAPVLFKLAKGKSGGLRSRWAMLRSEHTGRFQEVRGE